MMDNLFSQMDDILRERVERNEGRPGQSGIPGPPRYKRDPSLGLPNAINRMPVEQHSKRNNTSSTRSHNQRAKYATKCSNRSTGNDKLNNDRTGRRVSNHGSFSLELGASSSSHQTHRASSVSRNSVPRKKFNHNFVHTLHASNPNIRSALTTEKEFSDYQKRKPLDINKMSNIKFGYKRLKDLAEEKDSDEIVLHICQNYDLFNHFLKDKPRTDILNLFLKVMVKAMGTRFKENKLKLYALLCQKHFVDHLNNHITQYINLKDSKKLADGLDFFINLNSLFEDLMMAVPNKAVESMDTLLSVVLMTASSICSRDPSFRQVVESSQKLRDDMDLLQETCQDSQTKCIKLVREPQPPDDFRELSLHPTPEDFTQDNFLRSNIVEGSYEDPYHYLDVQFRLLREDFIDPLRQGILLYREKLVSHEAKKKKNFSIRIYRNVRFLTMSYDAKNPGELSHVVQLDCKLCSKVRWEYSKRLLFGSLCLFSKDNFETFQLTTVSDRNINELKTSGRISVCLVGNNVFGNQLFTTDFVMAESSAFYEPVFQVLNTIVSLPTDTLPMQKYLLVKDINAQRPKYLTVQQEIDIEGTVVSLDKDADWPPCETLGFNESQLSALKASLTNEFVVIQGPPGTGKTYLGLKMVKTLLNNFTFVSPILIVCYTNHALDQFLEGLLSVTKDIIRIGGQSKSEHLNEYNYQVVRRRHRIQRHPAIAELKDTLTRSLNKIASFNKLITGIQYSCGIIDFLRYPQANLRGVKSFESSSDLLSWLLGDLFNPLNYLLKEYKTLDEESKAVDPENSILKDEEDELDDDEVRRRKYFDAFNDLEDLALLSEVKGKIHYSLTMDKLKRISRHLQNCLFELNSNGSSDEDKQEIITDITVVEGIKTRVWNHLNEPDTKPSKRYSDLLKENLWGVSETDRWALYHYWVRDIHKYASDEIINQQTSYSQALSTMKEIKVMEDYACLKQVKPKILGLTTTGAARHHNLIAALKPQVTVVEEAAEVLEAHILVSLTKSCQHLILIGDHKQLKPNPSTFKLAKKYHLDISLFERMIRNGVCCHSLNVQHRMKPNIASLIAPTIYADLNNHHSVEQYPPVMGLPNNLFFIDHTCKELKDEDMESHSNPHEASFMISLCRHLLLQGYEPSDITILTTYSAQQFLLRDLRKQHSQMKAVRITVVDNYQGEESKIILLSLVRSNDEGKIGFLGIENRICVALSRAQHGLYIIGNMTHLKNNSEIWTKIYGTLEQHKSIGEGLSLVCQVHQDVVTVVKEAQDFHQVMEGGCNLMCLRMMPCGHTCRRLCHVIDIEHTNATCTQPCNREICEEAGHRCPLKCYEKCKPCEVPMKRDLPQCGHNATIPCHVQPSEYKCKIIVNDNKEDCKHPVERYCFMDISRVRCLTPCDVRLDCGHACSRTCHVNNDPDHIDYKCMKDCTKRNAECQRNHMCGKRCYEECGKCAVKVKRTLLCGHIHDIECSMDLSLFQCTKPCKRTMECGHRCKKQCNQPCGDCKEMVEKTVEECGHVIKLRCSIPPTRSLCKAACQRCLPCGHQCKLKCSQDCALYKCQEYVDSPVPPACGHKGQVLCYSKNDFVDGSSDLLLRYCKEPCGKELPCKDICSGTCGNCMQGRLHQVCNQQCGNILICGHKCTVPCRDECPPCKLKCLFRCRHSVCRRKCGVPCVPCMEKCRWECEHLRCTRLCGEMCDREPCNEPCLKNLACGHPCVGFCGEPCPPLCRICNKEELCAVFFGTEEEEDARFVLLNDCEHILESSGLDEWFRVAPEEGKDRQIGVRRCPKCNTNIITTLRYGNAIKSTFQLIQKVKQKIFGANSAIQELQKDLADNLLPCLMTLVSNCPEFVSDERHLKEIISSMQKVVRVSFGSRYKQNKLGIGELRLYKFLCLYLNELLESCLGLKFPGVNLPFVSGLYSKIQRRFCLLMYHLSKRKDKISTIEMKQFEMEFNRFSNIVHFYHTVQPLRLTNTSIVEAQRIVSRFFSTRTFDYQTDITREIKAFLASNQSGSVVYNEVTQEERTMIHNAMKKDFLSGTKQGHWFQCSKGHIYAITECGGAMESSHCPECKETIGGSQHTLVNTSRLAAIMDNAAHPAWSDRNNMAFYRF